MTRTTSTAIRRHDAPFLDNPLFRVVDASDRATDGEWSHENVPHATAGDEALVLGRLAASGYASIRDTARRDLEFG